MLAQNLTCIGWVYHVYAVHCRDTQPAWFNAQCWMDVVVHWCRGCEVMQCRPTAAVHLTFGQHESMSSVEWMLASAGDSGPALNRLWVGIVLTCSALLLGTYMFDKTSFSSFWYYSCHTWFVMTNITIMLLSVTQSEWFKCCILLYIYPKCIKH